MAVNSDRQESEARTMFRDWPIVCPRCRVASLSASKIDVTCTGCAARFPLVQGVWDLLQTLQVARYRNFLESYTRIRRAEGRTSDSADFYRALPDCPPSHPLAWQWRIRRTSYVALVHLLGQRLNDGARVLDVGAGSGWLANRLDLAGYAACAIDLSADAGDGLGAARHFAGQWPRLRADFDQLPLADGAVDAIVFNASFHYSADYWRTLAEACRVTRRGGLVVILDSPVYRNAASGRQMLEEQADDRERRFGDRSDSLSAEGFLTWQRLRELGAGAGLAWHSRKPWYGLPWALAPLRAALRGRREPARFLLLWAAR